MTDRSIVRSTALAMAVALPGLSLGAVCMITSGAFEPSGLLDRFQTLIAGLIAIVAALIGGAFILHQVKAAERIEENRRGREFRGAQAGLSAILDTLLEYNKKCERELDRVYAVAGSGTLVSGVEVSFANLPPEIVPGLRELVRLGGEKEAETIEAVLSHLQILQSRLRSFEEGASGTSRLIVTKYEMANRLLDCATLNAMASRLFDFARRRGPCPPPDVTLQELRSALDKSEADWSLAAEAVEILDRREIRGR